MTQRIGWIDATGGVSGDMLLGACLDAGVQLAVVQAAIDQLGLPEPIVIEVEQVQRAGLGATRALVRAPGSQQLRTLAEITELLRKLDDALCQQATAVFTALADAEAHVHRMPVEQVHFHELGALDSIADVVGVIAALRELDVTRLISSPIALGGGQAETAHGPIPVPGPAVVELLRARQVPGFGGPVPVELATPTGVALLAVLADEFASLPLLRPELVGVGAGGRDPAGHANITRLVVGESETTDLPLRSEPTVILEANVDDLDPRLWPPVLAELLAAGASDAWLTPIVMKKGRPAHMLSVLAEPARVASLERLVFRHTSTIGLRRRSAEKVALARESLIVEVYGAQVRVKIARLDGEIVNAVPEYEDLARVAAAQGLPVIEVLDAARAVVTRLLVADPPAR